MHKASTRLPRVKATQVVLELLLVGATGQHAVEELLQVVGVLVATESHVVAGLAATTLVHIAFLGLFAHGELLGQALVADLLVRQTVGMEVELLVVATTVDEDAHQDAEVVELVALKNLPEEAYWRDLVAVDAIGVELI